MIAFYYFHRFSCIQVAVNLDPTFISVKYLKMYRRFNLFKIPYSIFITVFLFLISMYNFYFLRYSKTKTKNMFINYSRIFRTRENNMSIMISLRVRLTLGFHEIKILELFVYYFLTKFIFGNIKTLWCSNFENLNCMKS